MVITSTITIIHWWMYVKWFELIWQDDDDGVKIGIVVAVVIVAAIIFFVVGFLVSRYCRKKRSGSFKVKNVSILILKLMYLETFHVDLENSYVFKYVNMVLVRLMAINQCPIQVFLWYIVLRVIDRQKLDCHRLSDDLYMQSTFTCITAIG